MNDTNGDGPGGTNRRPRARAARPACAGEDRRRGEHGRGHAGLLLDGPRHAARPDVRRRTASSPCTTTRARRSAFPYYVDEVDTEAPDPAAWEPFGVGQARGLTAYLLRTGTPQLITPERFRELEAQGEVVLVGVARGGRLARRAARGRGPHDRGPGRPDVHGRRALHAVGRRPHGVRRAPRRSRPDPRPCGRPRAPAQRGARPRQRHRAGTRAGARVRRDRGPRRRARPRAVPGDVDVHRDVRRRHAGDLVPLRDRRGEAHPDRVVRAGSRPHVPGDPEPAAAPPRHRGGAGQRGRHQLRHGLGIVAGRPHPGRRRGPWRARPREPREARLHGRHRAAARDRRLVDGRRAQERPPVRRDEAAAGRRGRAGGAARDHHRDPAGPRGPDRHPGDVRSRRRPPRRAVRRPGVRHRDPRSRGRGVPLPVHDRAGHALPGRADAVPRHPAPRHGDPRAAGHQRAGQRAGGGARPAADPPGRGAEGDAMGAAGRRRRGRRRRLRAEPRPRAGVRRRRCPAARVARRQPQRLARDRAPDRRRRAAARTRCPRSPTWRARSRRPSTWAPCWTGWRSDCATCSRSRRAPCSSPSRTAPSFRAIVARGDCRGRDPRGHDPPRRGDHRHRRARAAGGAGQRCARRSALGPDPRHGGRRRGAADGRADGRARHASSA